MRVKKNAVSKILLKQHLKTRTNIQISTTANQTGGQLPAIFDILILWVTKEIFQEPDCKLCSHKY